MSDHELPDGVQPKLDYYDKIWTENFQRMRISNPDLKRHIQNFLSQKLPKLGQTYQKQIFKLISDMSLGGKTYDQMIQDDEIIVKMTGNIPGNMILEFAKKSLMEFSVANFQIEQFNKAIAKRCTDLVKLMVILFTKKTNCLIQYDCKNHVYLHLARDRNDRLEMKEIKIQKICDIFVTYYRAVIKLLPDDERLMHQNNVSIFLMSKTIDPKFGIELNRKFCDLRLNLEQN